MTSPSAYHDATPELRDWRGGLLAGAVLGMLFLGVGARLGMRVIALAEGRSPALTLGGSVTVILLGTVTGVVVAAVFLLSLRLFPQRRFWRVTFFLVITSALVLRGLNPVNLLNAGVFVPLFAIHAALLHAYVCRWRESRFYRKV